MKTFNVDLYDYFNLPRGKNAGGKLTVILHENSPEINPTRKHPAMLVLPGGAYVFCSDREAEPVAEAYYAEGFNAYILRYSVAPVSVYPTQLCEAAMAMAYIRREAEKQFTDKTHVAEIGFSAGGHLCGSIATMYAREPVKNIGIAPEEARPDAAIPSYAVISNGLGDGGTFNNLTAGNAALAEDLSIEKNVDENTPPLFIWHTSDDGCVDVTNCLRLAAAAKEHGVPFNLHVFERGQHGLSLTDDRVYSASAVPAVTSGTESWFALSVKWLKDRGFKVVD